MSIAISIEARDVGLASVRESQSGRLVVVDFRGEPEVGGYRPITGTFYLHGSHDERVAFVRALAKAEGLALVPAAIADDFGELVEVPT